jgi:hypothetical protein
VQHLDFSKAQCNSINQWASEAAEAASVSGFSTGASSASSVLTTAIGCKGLLLSVKQATYTHSELYGL